MAGPERPLLLAQIGGELGCSFEQPWIGNFKGVIDDPRRRNGYHPGGFTPKENPFYFALPYGEFVDGDPDNLKLSARNVPWYRHGLEPLLKDQWLKVAHGDSSVVAVRSTMVAIVAA